ncbi:hypothetical protein [Azonexus hydrophilus]
MKDARRNETKFIYRNSFCWQSLKDLWIDGKCVGESAPNVFFHTEVRRGEPDQNRIVFSEHIGVDARERGRTISSGSSSKWALSSTTPIWSNEFRKNQGKADIWNWNGASRQVQCRAVTPETSFLSRYTREFRRPTRSF